MVVRVFLFVLLPLGVLAGCATLSEGECRRGDWYSIGVEDGAAGRLASYLGRHAEACAKHGIAVDPAPWHEGREVGLRSYCTPARAYREGRRGAELRPVCPAGDLRLLTRANEWGLRYHALGREIAALERDLDEVTRDLEALHEDDTEARVKLRRERRYLHRQIERLEWERQDYAYWT